MEPGWYALATGRHVWLQRVFIRRTALGIMIGKPEYVRDDVLGRLQTDVEQVFGSVGGVYLHPPSDGPLPEYLVMAEYLSHQPINKSADLSTLVVCWFSDSMAVDEPLIESKVTPVDWDAHAHDGYW